METLRRFVRRRQPGEHCELCSLPLSEQHEHLVELAGHRVLCCCQACAVLFDNDGQVRYRRVSHTIERLADFRLDDAQWNRLDVPVELVFFWHDSQAGRVVAHYPSPGGTIASTLNLEEWQSIVASNPLLETFVNDVEALLVRRVGRVREFYRVPIDECYRLVATVRTHWHGFSAGTEVQAAIAQFFEQLDRRAVKRETGCR